MADERKYRYGAPSAPPRPTSGGRVGSPSNRGTTMSASSRAAQLARQKAAENRRIYGEYQQGRIADHQASQAFPNYQDPFGGLSQFDVLANLSGFTDTDPGGGGGGRGGGGGGGGRSAADIAQEEALRAQQKAAYQQALAAISDGSARFSDYEAQLRNANQAAVGRNAGIFNDLMGQSALAGQRINQAYGSSDQALQALAQQYMQRGQSVDAGAARMAEAFGGRADPSGGSVADLANAARVLNTQRQGFANQAQAQAGNVYGALQSDLNLGVGQNFDALLARLQASRLEAAQQAEKERAALMLQAANQGVQV